MTPNPYFIGPPVRPDQFIGRTTDLNAIFDLLSKGTHVAIWGTSGMGKSSLLRYLAAPVFWEARGSTMPLCIYLNCTTGLRPFTPASFFAEIFKQLREKSDGDPALQGMVEDASTAPSGQESLLRVLRHIGKGHGRLLLLLDDFVAALRVHTGYSEAEMLSFLTGLRHVANHSEDGSHLITAVTTFRRLNEQGPPQQDGSQWYNHYIFHLLRPFDSQEVSQIVGHLSFHPAMTSEVWQTIDELTGGHPALLQNACYLLFEALKSKRDPRDEFERRFPSATEHFFSNAWRQSSRTEQMVMMLVALSRLSGRLPERNYKLSGIEAIFSQRGRELNDLEERSVLRRVTDPWKGTTSYFFVSSVMEWWVIKEIENSPDEAKLKEREAIFGYLSTKQLEQIKGVMRAAWMNKDALGKFAQWAYKLWNSLHGGTTSG